jgi:CBS domain containing-hemolysin-like protein
VEEIDTLGGLLMSRLEVVPQKGQSSTFRGLRLTAEEVDERRIHTVLVERVGRR